MPTFVAALDLTRNELREAVTQNLPTAPTSPVAGLRYFDSTLLVERYYDGLRWVNVHDTIDAWRVTGLGDLALLDQVGAAEIAAGSISDVHVSPTAAIALSKLAVDPLQRANHNGTQSAATINNFDAAVRTSALDQMAPPTGPVDFAGQRLTSVATPTTATDAVNKAYADSIASGLDVKDSVRTATVATINLASAPPTIAGVALGAGDRVLVKAQTAAAENGIYVFNGAGAAMTRAPDADSSTEVSTGMFCLVVGGVLASTGWILTTPDPINLDTTGLSFTQFSASGASYVGTANRIDVTGNQIDIAATYAGQGSITTLGTITTGTWQATPVAIAYGGTGATTAALARANLGAAGKAVVVIGDGSFAYNVTHGLNTLNVTVELYETTSKRTVIADVTRVDANTVRIDGFLVAPNAGSTLTVVVTG